mmetsp:Transcript_3691/g.10442  ORF Transcript_3691/g.10442 Transcript_3691/m.10442 type:complete len:212 (-) Transcript_3691:1243-1878(-)
MPSSSSFECGLRHKGQQRTNRTAYRPWSTRTSRSRSGSYHRELVSYLGDSHVGCSCLCLCACPGARARARCCHVGSREGSRCSSFALLFAAFAFAFAFSLLSFRMDRYLSSSFLASASPKAIHGTSLLGFCPFSDGRRNQRAKAEEAPPPSPGSASSWSRSRSWSLSSSSRSKNTSSVLWVRYKGRSDNHSSSRVDFPPRSLSSPVSTRSR